MSNFKIWNPDGQVTFKIIFKILQIFVQMGAITLILINSANAQSMPSGFHEIGLQGSSPIYEEGVVSYHLKSGDCSSKDYGDGRGESDCSNGNLRSQIITDGNQYLGSEVEYSMDMWIDRNFTFSGNFGQSRSPLLLAEWQRIDTIKNHLYEIYFDTASGVKFEDKICFNTSQLGKWNSFKMIVKWSREDDGYLKVYCNNRLAYEIRGQTATPPLCGTRNKFQCELQRLDFSQPVRWQVGPKLGGFGTIYKEFGLPSQFRKFPSDGLRVKVKNLYYGNVRN